jgi:hypothetical protein
LINGVSELRHELDKLIEASMNVPDDVERAMLGLLVIPKRMTLNRHGIHFFRAGEFEDMADAFALQSAQGAPELLRLIANDVRPKLPVGTMYVAVLAYALGEVEDNRLCKEMKLLRQRDKRLPRLWLDISRVDDGQATTSEPLTISCSRSKASPVADWSFSLSDTSARQKSEETTSVGRKCFRPNDDLPEPEGPTSRTSDSSGMLIFMPLPPSV